ncbi:AAA family ATPase [Blastococcus mobilis]|uniref:Pilus assembly protein CpaE n=1 Tax=Blastococcus mobilis TaxID=1938746 RepID=A0A238Y9G2_9ACTN|nr:AAA family ATPase [Blastococcus mobilis]SNR66979.1 pilus assembly protein CpaE [Blastococcus mobilis]
MSRVVLAGAGEELILRVKEAADGDVAVLPPGRLPSEPARLFEQLLDGELPDVLLVGPHAPAPEVLTLASRLDVQSPGISVVLMAEPSPEMWQAAMRAGIRDLLPPSADVADIRAAVERAGHAAASRRRVLRPVSETERYAGRVITIASPKGGVGKTTVSTNLAIGLTAAAPQSTVLVDLDVQFGDVASALSLVPEYTLPDAVRGPASEDTMVLKTFLTQHPSGLYAVCGAESPAAGDTVTGEDVTRLLASLAREFRYVVVDTAPGLSEQTLAALDRATDVIMLTSMDVPGVRGLRKELDVLRELAMIPAGRHIVMNFADPKGGLTVRDVETTIGAGVDVVLPRSKAVPASTNQGVPILQSNRRDPMAKEMRRLVSRFAATPLMKPGKYRARHRAAS